MAEPILIGLVHSLGLLTLLSFFYGSVARSAFPGLVQKVIIGAIMGLGAIFAMSAPTSIAEGIQVDGRTVFVAISAAFGGPVAAIVSGVMAAAYRVSLGGAGAMSGALGVALAIGIGLAWYKWVPETARGKLRNLAILGLALPFSFLAVLLLPAPIATKLLTTVLPVLIPYFLVSTVIFGTLLSRERRLVYTENELKKAANNDFLTGLLNRRAFTSRMIDTHNTASDRQIGTLVVLDIDHFKKINDTLGHAAGDAALAQFGNLLQHICRGSDIISRLGGEEFGIYMPDTTTKQARTALERLLAAIRALAIDVEGKTISITASAGAHQFAPARTTFENALHEADRALYRAKEQGRNRVIFSDAERVAV